MTRPVTFRQSDVAAAIKAVKAGGESVASVEFRPDGSFRVLTAANTVQSLSPFEAWERQDGERAA